MVFRLACIDLPNDALVKRSFQGRIRAVTSMPAMRKGGEEPRALTWLPLAAATLEMIEPITSYRANKGLPHEEVNEMERRSAVLRTRSLSIRVFG